MDLSMYNLLSFCLIEVHPERRTGTRELFFSTHILVSLILHANARVCVVVEAIICRTSCLKMLSPGCILPSEHGKRVALHASSRGTWISCTDHGWHLGAPGKSILFVQQTHDSFLNGKVSLVPYGRRKLELTTNLYIQPIELQEGDPSSSLDW